MAVVTSLDLSADWAAGIGHSARDKRHKTEQHVSIAWSHYSIKQLTMSSSGVEKRGSASTVRVSRFASIYPA